MSMYKVIDIKTLAKELIQNQDMYEIDIATDFDFDRQSGDIIDEYETSCYYCCKKLQFADSVFVACVFYGGSFGNNLLFDINMQYDDDLDNMVDDLAKELKQCLDVYGDNLVAMQIKQTSKTKQYII